MRASGARRCVPPSAAGGSAPRTPREAAGHPPPCVPGGAVRVPLGPRPGRPASGRRLAFPRLPGPGFARRPRSGSSPAARPAPLRSAARRPSASLRVRVSAPLRRPPRPPQSWPAVLRSRARKTRGWWWRLLSPLHRRRLLPGTPWGTAAAGAGPRCVPPGAGCSGGSNAGARRGVPRAESGHARENRLGPVGRPCSGSRSPGGSPQNDRGPVGGFRTTRGG